MMKRLLLLFILVVPLTSHAQVDGDLEAVIEAYRDFDEWSSYTVQVQDRLQLAYALETDAGSLSRTENTVHNFDAAYDVQRQAVDGNYSETQILRIVTDSATAQIISAEAELRIINVEDQLFASGEVISETNDERETLVLEALEPAPDQIRTPYLDQLINYSEFRDIEAFVDFLETEGVLEEATTLSIDQFEGDLVAVTIQLDSPERIAIVHPGFESHIADLLASPSVDRERLLEAIAEESEVALHVYLDAETGRLVAEDIVVSFDVEWEDDQPSDGTLFIEYSYNQTTLYSDVNIPVEIEIPAPNTQ